MPLLENKLNGPLLPNNANSILVFKYVRNFCSAYQEFEDCVKTYRGYCPTAVRVQLEGLEDLYNYVCGEGFERQYQNETDN